MTKRLLLITFLFIGLLSGSNGLSPVSELYSNGIQTPEISCPVHAGFSVAQYPFCKTDLLQMINSSWDAIFFEWFCNGLLVSIEKHPAIQLDSIGTFHIMLIASNYICSDTAEMIITVNDVFYTQHNAFICYGDTVSLNGNIYTNSGVYQIKLKSSLGCDSIIELHVLVDSLVSSFTIEGGTATAPINYYSYQWFDCDAGFIPVPGATCNVFQPSKSGNYALVATSLYCADTSACQTILVTGIDDYLNAGGLKVFPNPARDYINVSGLRPDITYEFCIISPDGKLVDNVRLTGQNNRVLLNQLPKGLYFLRMVSPVSDNTHWRFMVE